MPRNDNPLLVALSLAAAVSLPFIALLLFVHTFSDDWTAPPRLSHGAGDIRRSDADALADVLNVTSALAARPPPPGSAGIA